MKTKEMDLLSLELIHAKGKFGKTFRSQFMEKDCQQLAAAGVKGLHAAEVYMARGNLVAGLLPYLRGFLEQLLQYGQLVADSGDGIIAGKGNGGKGGFLFCHELLSMVSIICFDGRCLWIIALFRFFSVCKHLIKTEKTKSNLQAENQEPEKRWAYLLPWAETEIVKKRKFSGFFQGVGDMLDFMGFGSGDGCCDACDDAGRLNVKTD
jgi:hypothetical protein